ARNHFESALQQHPDSASTKYHLGLATLGMGEYDLAGRLFEEVLQQLPGDYLATSNLAYVKLRQGDTQRCRDLLVPLVLEQPNDVHNLRRLGTAELLLQDYDAASKRFRTLVQLDETQPLDYAKLAWSEAAVGRRSEAKRHLQLAEKLAPGDPSVARIARIIADLLGGP
ncbi:MAG: tetratricopeptide repeat protein, partial [Pirellulales bacterium]